MSRNAPVTVVIPAWQAGEFLAATLDSLRALSQELAGPPDPA
jgi:hypothetical protein